MTSINFRNNGHGFAPIQFIHILARKIIFYLFPPGPELYFTFSCRNGEMGKCNGPDKINDQKDF